MVGTARCTSTKPGETSRLPGEHARREPSAGFAGGAGETTAPRWLAEHTHKFQKSACEFFHDEAKSAFSEAQLSRIIAQFVSSELKI
jgi:hypothetical protein